MFLLSLLFIIVVFFLFFSSIVFYGFVCCCLALGLVFCFILALLYMIRPSF